MYKKGDKVRVVKHAHGCKVYNENRGLNIGSTHEVVESDEEIITTCTGKVLLKEEVTLEEHAIEQPEETKYVAFNTTCGAFIVSKEQLPDFTDDWAIHELGPQVEVNVKYEVRRKRLNESIE